MPFDGGDAEASPLSDLRFDGQAKDSPLVVLLSVDFKDGDGDLDDGTLLTFIDGSPTSAGPLDLLPIFLESNVKQGAVAGTLSFVLELSFKDGEPPPSGTTFALGADVTDGAGNSSERPEIRLKLEY